MKKLILGAAFVLAFVGTAIAQTDSTKVQTTTPAATSQPAVTQQPTTASPAATTGSTAVTTAPQTTATPAQTGVVTDASGKEFTKVTQNQIAPAVLKKAVVKYEGYALRQALAAIDGSEYKLVLTKNGKDVAAYYKANGEFIREETV